MQHLDLSGNRLGSAGAKALAEAFPVGLQHLDLERNSLGAEGAKALVKAWKAVVPASMQHLDLAGNGVGRAVLAAPTPGLYRVTDGALTALATKGALNPLEFRDLRASAGKVQAAAKASGGGVHWIAKGIPDFRRTRPGRDSHGRGWAGLVANRSFVVSGLVQAPLLTGVLVMILVLGGLMAAWHREGR